MRQDVSPELDTLLASGDFEYANLYEIVFHMGETIRLTSADRDIEANGFTYLKAKIGGGKLRLVRGLEVDEGEFSWVPDESLTINGLTMREAVLRGFMDRAIVRYSRAFLPDWGSPVTGVMLLFLGETADVELGGPTIILKVNSLLVLLNSNVPSQVYQASCRHLFGSTACGVNVDALTADGALLEGSTKSKLLFTDASADHAWQHGRVLMTSGPNAGISRTVKASVAGELTLAGPLPFLPVAGDAFTLYPGCDKTLTANGASSGCGRFNNRLHFGGQPWVPVPESAT